MGLLVGPRAAWACCSLCAFVFCGLGSGWRVGRGWVGSLVSVPGAALSASALGPWWGGGGFDGRTRLAFIMRFYCYCHLFLMLYLCCCGLWLWLWLLVSRLRLLRVVFLRCFCLAVFVGAALAVVRLLLRCMCIRVRLLACVLCVLCPL